MHSVNQLPVSELAYQLNNTLDVLVCACSFEERSTTIPLALADAGAHQLIVFRSKSIIHESQAHLDLLRNRYGTRCKVIDTDAQSPLYTAQAIDSTLMELVRSGVPHGKVYFDITTFNREGLLILLRLLQVRLRDVCKGMILYNAARSYARASSRHSEPERPNVWLSEGVREVRSVLGYPGEMLPSRRTHLMVLVGFESARAREVVDCFEPHLLSIGCGESGTWTSIEQGEHDVEHLKALKAVHPNVEEFRFPCNSPYGARDAIAAQAAKFPDHNVVIAPMNNKLSTVGAALAALSNRSMQLAYAEALVYNYRYYSRASDAVYMCALPEFIAVG